MSKYQAGFRVSYSIELIIEGISTWKFRMEFCESLWLLECGVTAGQLNNGK